MIHLQLYTSRTWIGNGSVPLMRTQSLCVSSLPPSTLESQDWSWPCSNMSAGGIPLGSVAGAHVAHLPSSSTTPPSPLPHAWLSSLFGRLDTWNSQLISHHWNCMHCMLARHKRVKIMLGWVIVIHNVDWPSWSDSKNFWPIAGPIILFATTVCHRCKRFVYTTTGLQPSSWNPFYIFYILTWFTYTVFILAIPALPNLMDSPLNWLTLLYQILISRKQKRICGKCRKSVNTGKQVDII